MPRIEIDVNTFFYSKRCQHCLEFIMQLKKRDLLKDFPKKVCIDDPQYRRMLPPFLKEVPCILVTDFDEPIQGDAAFNWLKFKDRQIKEANNKKVVEANGGTEISGFSDGFGSDFGSIMGVGTDGDNSAAYQGLGKNLQRGSASNSQVPESMYGGLIPESMKTQANASNGGNGDFDKRLAAMENSRSLDMPSKQGGGGGQTPNFQR